jgi:inorganic pyrophosphatase
MIPKKPNSLYKEITDEFECSEQLVDDLVHFYYKTLKKKMSNLTDLRLNVEGLGHFVLKMKKVKDTIPHYEKVLSNHDTSTFGAYHNKKSIEEKLEKLKNIDVRIQEELERRQKFKNEKYSKTNLEKQKGDSGRDN